jgi:ATP-dependent protease ClpP protease subunit
MTPAEKFAGLPPSPEAGPDILGMSTETHQITAIERPDSIKPHRELDVAAARADRPSPLVVTAHDNGATIDIFCEIGGWGVYACEIIYQLQELDGEGRDVEIRLHSDGGDVFEAFAIATAIMLMKATVTVTIYGVAASAATFIVAAADKVRAARHSMLMVHEPSAWIFGNASKLAEAVSLLERLRESVARMYSAATDGVISYETALDEWMAPGVSSWFTAEAAQAFGLVDEIIDDVVAVAYRTPSNLTGELPAGVAQMLAGPADADPEAAAEDAQVGDQADEPAPAPAPEATESETPADPELTPEAASEIRIACKVLGAPERADEFITARAGLDQVREALWNARAEASAQLNIDTRVTPRAEDAATAAAKAKATTKVEQAAEIRRRQIAALSPKQH